MSNTQNRIISKLLSEASLSPQNTKVAAAICRGSKILSININSHRNKYGDEVRCSGHGEIAAIHSLYPKVFRRRRKGSRVL
jgi:hypothetical protein|tara:strand:+ start:1537 stop:1779 length:243 start_codon:yes stop_codon:yes gene_type:complete